MIALGTTQPQLKFLEKCEQGELVRGKFIETTEWAIVSNRGNELQNVVVLPKNKPPVLINAHAQEQIMLITCLSYGDKFRIIPNHAGQCEVDNGLKLDVPGQLVITATDLILVTSHPRGRAPTAYYYSTTKEMKGLPGGAMAVFSDWSIWIDDLLDCPNPSKLFEFKVRP